MNSDEEEFLLKRLIGDQPKTFEEAIKRYEAVEAQAQILEDWVADFKEEDNG